MRGRAGDRHDRARRGPGTSHGPAVNPRVAPALEAICLKALALEPEGRCDTAAALKTDIQRWLADEPVTAWHKPWAVPAGRWLGRHHTLVAAAAATVLVAAASLALATVLLQRATAARSSPSPSPRRTSSSTTSRSTGFTTTSWSTPRSRPPAWRPCAGTCSSWARRPQRNLVPRLNTPAARAELGRTYLHYAQILDQLGDAKQVPEQFQKALSVFETLNRSAPRRAEYLVDEARVLCELGRWHQSNSPSGTAIPLLERAVPLLESAARLQPGDARIRFELRGPAECWAECTAPFKFMRSRSRP